MTSAPRERPRVMVPGGNPAPSIPVGTRIPTPSGGALWSGIMPPSWAVGGRQLGRRGPAWGPAGPSIDERGDTGRDADAHRPLRQRALRAHGQLHRPDGDAVLVVVTEIGGVQNGAPRTAARRVGLGDLDVLRPDPDGPAPPGMLLGYRHAVAELRCLQDRGAVRSGGDGAGEEVALAEELGDRAQPGVPVVPF